MQELRGAIPVCECVGEIVNWGFKKRCFLWLNSHRSQARKNQFAPLLRYCPVQLSDPLLLRLNWGWCLFMEQTSRSWLAVTQPWARARFGYRLLTRFVLCLGSGSYSFALDPRAACEYGRGGDGDVASSWLMWFQGTGLVKGEAKPSCSAEKLVTWRYLSSLHLGLCIYSPQLTTAPKKSSLFQFPSSGNLSHELYLWCACSCRCLWCVQLVLVHASSAWYALMGFLWLTCYRDRRPTCWLGYLQHQSSAHCSTLSPCYVASEDPTSDPCPGRSPDGLLGVSHHQLTGLSSGGDVDTLTGVKFRGTIYFVVWARKQRGDPQHQRPCFPAV